MTFYIPPEYNNLALFERRHENDVFSRPRPARAKAEAEPEKAKNAENTANGAKYISPFFMTYILPHRCSIPAFWR
jgi:hypothetical protein